MEQKLTIRKDTSTYTIEDIKNEIQECVSLLISLGYTSMAKNYYDVEFSTRRTKNFGTCQRLKEHHFKIVLNKHYVELASPENVHNTIMHEIIHSVPGCMNHQQPWKSVAAKVNANYKFTTLKRLGYDKNYYEKYLNNAANNKYKVTCNSCKHFWYYKRRSSVVQTANLGKCTCPYCKSHSFTVFML